MTYSFDIFDTCLVRKCGSPQNMLDVLSYGVFLQSVEDWERQEFISARRNAEISLSGKHDAGIEDIYASLDFNHPYLLSRENLIRKELEIERMLLVPVADMLEKVAGLRNKGCHIIFISDMYLPREFILDIMSGFGFYKEGDSLYVSNDVGKIKADGSLYEYVRESEHISYGRWHHIGDNVISDVRIPRALGIHTEFFCKRYTKYPQQWKACDFGTDNKCMSVLAGLCRSLNASEPDNTHRDFVVDLIAPFYCSLVVKILEDAFSRGIGRLYFCARDAHVMYEIARKFAVHYPSVEVRYLYVSRTALYEGNSSAKLEYFKQVGLADVGHRSAIVDTTTSGKTLTFLNEYLRSEGYDEVYGYYFLLWNEVDGTDRNMLSAQIYDSYIQQNPNYDRLLKQLPVFENFFALNNQKRTVDYRMNGSVAEPVFDSLKRSEEPYIDESKDWASIHMDLITRFADGFWSLGLWRFSDTLFRVAAMPAVASFFSSPDKCYLKALQNFYCYRGNTSTIVPVIKRTSAVAAILRLDNEFYWRRGTLFWNLPQFFKTIWDFKRQS